MTCTCLAQSISKLDQHGRPCASVARMSQVHFLEANSASFLEAAKFVWRKGDPDQFAAHVVAFLWRHGATVALEGLLPDTLHS